MPEVYKIRLGQTVDDDYRIEWADNYLFSATADTNYGAASTIRVLGLASNQARIVTKFNFLPVLNDLITSSDNIVSAGLYFRMTTDTNNTYVNYLDIHYLPTNWDEPTSTYNNSRTGSAWATAGALGVYRETIEDSQAWSDISGSDDNLIYKPFVITQAIKDIFDGVIPSGGGFLIKHHTEGVASSSNIYFWSIDAYQVPALSAGYMPYLEIMYEVPSAFFPEDGLTFTDSASGITTFEPSAYDGFELTDTSTNTLDTTASVSDSFTLSDSSSATFEYPPSAGILFSDSASATHVMVDSVSAGIVTWDNTQEVSTITFGERDIDDYNGVTSDNHMEQQFPTTNNGSDEDFFIEEDAVSTKRGLLKFDFIDDLTTYLGGVDTNRIASATLYVYCATLVGGAALQLYKLNKDWVENTSTYNVYDTGNSWDTAGADSYSSNPGGSNDIYGTAAVSSIIAGTGWISVDVTDHIIDWFSGDENNYGWRAANPYGGYARFYTSDRPTESQRPYLEIELRYDINVIPEDGFTFGDEASGGITITQSLSDGIELSDSSSESITFGPSASDQFDLSDDSTNTLSASDSISDSIILSDSEDNTFVDAGVSATDGIIFSETIAGGLLVIPSGTDDSFILSDSGVSLVDFSDSISDGITLSETISELLTYPVTATDLFELSDFVSIENVLPLSASDTFSMADSGIGIMDFGPSAYDGITLTDSIVPSAQVNVSLSEEVVFSEYIVNTHENVIEVRFGENTADTYNEVTKDAEITARKDYEGGEYIANDHIYPHGDLPNMGVSRYYYPGNLHPARKSLVEFDFQDILTQIVSGANQGIVSGGFIDAAYMWLYCNTEVNENISVYRLKRGWTECGVTWMAPSANDKIGDPCRSDDWDAEPKWEVDGAEGSNDRDSTPIDTQPITTTGWKRFDVTEFVQGVLNGDYDNKGFLLENNSADWTTQFWTKESDGVTDAGGDGKWPYLQVFYESTPEDFYPSDEVVLSDEATTVFTDYVSAADGVIFSEEISGAYRFPTDHSASDGFVFSDVGVHVIPEFISDEFILSDSISGAPSGSILIVGASGSEVIIFSDTESNTFVDIVSASDGFIFTDDTPISAGTGNVITQSLSEEIVFSDILYQYYADSVTDTFTMSDSAGTIVIWGPSASDGITFSEEIVYVLGGSHKTFSGQDLTLTFIGEGFEPFSCKLEPFTFVCVLNKVQKD